MIKHLCQTGKLLVLLPFLVALHDDATAQDNARRFSTLEVHGEVHRNACATAELKKLRKALASKKVAEEAQVWRAVETLLCAPLTKSNKRYISSILANKIRESAEGTGQDSDFAVIKPGPELAASLFANQAAWDAGIDVDGDGDHVTVHYRPDEACMNSRTLRYIKPKWRLSEVGQGCD